MLCICHDNMSRSLQRYETWGPCQKLIAGISKAKNLCKCIIQPKSEVDRNADCGDIHLGACASTRYYLIIKVATLCFRTFEQYLGCRNCMYVQYVSVDS